MLFSTLLAVASISAVAVAESYSYEGDCSTSRGSFQGQNYKCDASGDVTVFYQCDHGKWVRMPCAAGTVCEVEPWLQYRQSPCVADYHPSHGGYAPEPPAYSPKKPTYTPTYAPKKPSYTPSKPSNTPAKPSYTPSYTPLKPSYPPSKPSYTPAKPSYTPSYTPLKPSYTPSKPSYTSSEPSYTPSYGNEGDCSTSAGSWKGQNYKCDASGDSSVFYQCDHGEWVEMRCAAGTECSVDPWLQYHQSPCVTASEYGYGYRK